MVKVEADYCKRIAIWDMVKNIHKKGGYIKGKVHWGEEDNISVVVNVVEPNKQILFKYSITDDCGSKKFLKYSAKLVTTKCNFGGLRYWFICPLVKRNISCEKRVGVFYIYGDYFGCRNCYNLTYSSRNKRRTGSYAILENAFEVEEGLDKIYGKKFNKFYKGNPTRTQRRLCKIQNKGREFGYEIR